MNTPVVVWYYMVVHFAQTAKDVYPPMSVKIAPSENAYSSQRKRIQWDFPTPRKEPASFVQKNSSLH